MPRVLVVVPAYNAAATLGETLRSVFAQTFDDLEVVVVDDGSTDATGSVSELSARGVSYVQQANAGVSAARNRGIDHHDSDLIAFLDADDLWEPDKIAVHVETFDRRPEVGLTYASVVRIDERGATFGAIPAIEHIDPVRALLLHGTIVTGPSSVVVRRAALGDLRFDNRFSQVADWHMWLRLGLRTRFAAIPRPLMRYRSTPWNMSSDIGLLERDTFDALDAFFSEDPEAVPYRALRRHAYGNQLMIVAGSYLGAGRRRDALRCVARGVLMWPPGVVRPIGLPARRIRRALRR